MKYYHTIISIIIVFLFSSCSSDCPNPCPKVEAGPVTCGASCYEDVLVSAVESKIDNVVNKARINIPVKNIDGGYELLRYESEEGVIRIVAATLNVALLMNTAIVKFRTSTKN